MPLDLFDNVLLLHLALEAAKGIFERLTLLEFDFGQLNYTSQLNLNFLRAAGKVLIS